MTEIGPLVPLQTVTEYDEGPSWAVTVDEDTILLLDWLGDARKVVLYADIGGLPEDGRVPMLERALRYNAAWRETGGLRLSLDPDGMLTLLIDLPLAGIDDVWLIDVLRNFSDAVRGWWEILDADFEAAERPEDVVSDEPQSGQTVIRP